MLRILRVVDEVVVGRGLKPGLDFGDDFRQIRPQVLAVTEDHGCRAAKEKLCDEVGADYRVLEKTEPPAGPLSTSSILARDLSPGKFGF